MIGFCFYNGLSVTTKEVIRDSMCRLHGTGEEGIERHSTLSLVLRTELQFVISMCSKNLTAKEGLC